MRSSAKFSFASHLVPKPGKKLATVCRMSTPAEPLPCGTETCTGDASIEREYPCALCSVRYCRACERGADKTWYDILRLGKQPADILLCGKCVATKRWQKHPADILLAMNGERVG